MRCPFCESPLSPSSTVCDKCHLTFPKTCALFGTPPHIHNEIYDSTRLLTVSQSTSIHRHIARIRAKYPELKIQIVFHSFPPPHPIKTQVFWLFNAAGISMEIHRGTKNRTILIAIDPSSKLAAMMSGYALESCLDENHMNRLLESAEPHWANGDWAEGINTILNQLDSHFSSVATPDHSHRHVPDEF